MTAYESSRRLEQVIAPAAAGPSKYPNFGLARRLELIAQIIKAGFGTRIYYTSLDGFDTHANQGGTHAVLLTELSDSLAAFHTDLAGAGQGDRVAVLAFSEFGRRVAENASAGTDHGAAAPVFRVGPVAKPGLVGDHPSLDKLDDGDLIHHTDFRRVYAALLETWLGCPAAPVVGDGFPPLDLFRPAPEEERCQEPFSLWKTVPDTFSSSAPPGARDRDRGEKVSGTDFKSVPDTFSPRW